MAALVDIAQPSASFLRAILLLRFSLELRYAARRRVPYNDLAVFAAVARNAEAVIFGNGLFRRFGESANGDFENALGLRLEK
jgi:hypothetical protein